MKTINYNLVTVLFTFKLGISLVKREYKIFCVNEKIHTKKEVPSVE
ncbi:hypothetical protein I5V16_06320 [Enterococcus faecium]|nr:hypothetical protein [Enterococcus faecium]